MLPCWEVMPYIGFLMSPLPQVHDSSPLEAPGRRGMEVGGSEVDRPVLLCLPCSPGTGGPWRSISLFPGSLEHGSPGQLYGKSLPRRGWWPWGVLSVASVTIVTP